MRRGIWIALILTALSAHADGNWRLVWQPAESAIQDFKDLAKCEGRVWPGYTLKGQTIVVIDESREDQLAIEYSTQKKFKIKLSELPAGVKSGHKFFTLHGKSWISLAKKHSQTDPTPHSVFGLGTHEAFHQLLQSGWQWPQVSRGEQLPVRGEPRFYRAMLNLNLKNAFVNPSTREKSLGQARHWYDKWKAEFPGEVANSVDPQEGSAHYVEIISNALIQKGCTASEALLREFAVAEVLKLPDLLSGFGISELDAEAYVIPAVAEMILRFDSKISNWQARHMNGKYSGIDILLENVKPVIERANSDDFQSFIDIAELKQEQAGGTLAFTRERMSLRDSIYVSIPPEWKPGATSFSVFYYDTQSKVRFSVFYGPEVFQLGNLGKLETVEGMVAIEADIPIRCRKRGYVVPLFNEEVSQSDGGFKIAAELLNGQVKGALHEAGGYRWLCVGE